MIINTITKEYICRCLKDDHHCRFRVVKHHIGSDSNPDLVPELPGRLIDGFVRCNNFFTGKNRTFYRYHLSKGRVHFPSLAFIKGITVYIRSASLFAHGCLFWCSLVISHFSGVFSSFLSFLSFLNLLLIYLACNSDDIIQLLLIDLACAQIKLLSFVGAETI